MAAIEAPGNAGSLVQVLDAIIRDLDYAISIAEKDGSMRELTAKLRRARIVANAQRERAVG